MKGNGGGGWLKILGFLAIIALVAPMAGVNGAIASVAIKDGVEPGFSSSVYLTTDLTSHDPIYIERNGKFIPANGVNGGGSGTADDPYIIENWVIDASTGYGIHIKNTTAYFIVRNCLVENGTYGVFLKSVKNGRIENSACMKNDYGIGLSASRNNTLGNNTCYNNGLLGVGLSSSTNNTLSNNTCYNNGILGIGLYFSSNNTLENNICSNNGMLGIGLYFSSTNILSNNTCSSDGDCGIILYLSGSNTLTNNTALNNYYGIYLSSSSNNNLIHHNYLLNNGANAWDECANSWDDGSEGNWWSDWQPLEHPDANGDGIVDEPRLIEGGSNQDRYPLVPDIPFPPQLISPADDALLDDNTPTFRWKDVYDVSGVTYTLQVDDEGTFTAPLAYENAGMSENTCTITDEDALPSSTYYWRVRAVDGTGNEGDWSEVWQFTVPVQDFTVSVKPRKATVSPGESATATVTVSGMGGYDKTVKLSAKVKPSGYVTVTLSPRKGTPTFTSEMTIQTSSSTPPGTYKITIKGKGADGKVRTCRYRLTVTSG